MCTSADFQVSPHFMFTMWIEGYILVSFILHLFGSDVASSVDKSSWLLENVQNPLVFFNVCRTLFTE